MSIRVHPWLIFRALLLAGALAILPSGGAVARSARIDQHDRCDQEHFGKIHDRLAEIEAEQRADDERAALVLRLETRDLEKRNSGRAALIALIVAILGGSMAGLVEIAGRRFGAG